MSASRRRALAALASLGLLFGACGDSTDGGVDTDTAVPTSTGSETTPPASSTSAASTSVAPTTAAPTSAVETTVPPSTMPIPTSTTPGPTPALQALSSFLAQVDSIMADAAELWPIVDDARSSGAANLPESAWPLADDVGAGFYSLAGLLPHGLAPEVRAAAVTVIYDVGNHVAPFIFAPGFDFESWDPAWDDARRAGGEAVPGHRVALVEAASTSGELADVSPSSRAAAEDTILEIAVVRSFGHNLLSAPLPYALRWLGELPPLQPDWDVPDCANVPFGGGAFAGDFVEGVGGCVIVYYGTTDADQYEDDLQAFLADPGGVAQPPGEIVTVVWDDGSGAFAAYGSWE